MKGALDRQRGKIGDGEILALDAGADALDLVEGHLQELLQQAELGHELDGGGMNGIAAEIAQEILVLLEHRDLNPGTGEEKAEHHARRPATDDANLHAPS